MRLDATPIPANSFLVRFLDSPTSYDRMIVVTVEGQALRLHGWVGKPLTPAEWRQAKAALFPAATEVRFERWDRQRQAFRTAVLHIGAASC